MDLKYSPLWVENHTLQRELLSEALFVPLKMGVIASVGRKEQAYSLSCKNSPFNIHAEVA